MEDEINPPTILLDSETRSQIKRELRETIEKIREINNELKEKGLPPITLETILSSE